MQSIFRDLQQIKEMRYLFKAAEVVLAALGIEDTNSLSHRKVYADEMIEINKPFVGDTQIFSLERGKKELVFEYFITTERFHNGKWVDHLKTIYKNLLEKAEQEQKSRFLDLEDL